LYREQIVQTKLLDTFLANETPSLTPILSAKNTRRDDRGIHENYVFHNKNLHSHC